MGRGPVNSSWVKLTEENAFSNLCRPVRRLLEGRGFTQPTEPQRQLMPYILEGKNVLLISPTATGKTEAAMLPVFHKFLMSERKPGVSIIYITPLRALNRDIMDRMTYWCSSLDIKLAVRHGDTTTRERNRQRQAPPDMLITTPETLQAILSGRVLRRFLKPLRWIIIDEIHELADNKRGSQLSIALERVKELSDEPPQLIGLSATIGSPEKVAQFLVKPDLEDFFEIFTTRGGELDLAEIYVGADGPYTGKTLGETEFGSQGVVIVGIRRASGDLILPPSGSTPIQADDDLIALGKADAIAQMIGP